MVYLSEQKWADGFKCKKCGHSKFTIRKKNLAMDCNRCHHVESPTAGTLFHRVRFGVRKAFGIVFEMSATTKGLSSSQVAKRYGISRNTSWTFMHKVRNAIKSSKNHPLIGDVQVDEFVFGGKDAKSKEEVLTVRKRRLLEPLNLLMTEKLSEFISTR